VTSTTGPSCEAIAFSGAGRSSGSRMPFIGSDGNVDAFRDPTPPLSPAGHSR
jgi:hypothetical protein